MEQEIWKDIPNYEGLYQVSNMGQVKALSKTYHCGVPNTPNRFKDEHILKEHTNRIGYKTVAFSKNSDYKTRTIHRLVALLFVPNPYNKKEVNHLDGDKSNNKSSNLEWNTRSENIQHAFDTGLKISPKLGEHPAARIVLDTQTGIFYECIKEAAIAKNIKYTKLVNQLSGHHKRNGLSLIYV